MNNSYKIYKSKLKGEYRDVFEKVDIYVGATSIDSVSKEELLSSLLDTFLAAQEEGKPVEKITGKNINRFCSEICSGYGFKEHFMAFFEYIKPMVMIFCIWTLLEAIFYFSELGTIQGLSYFDYMVGIDTISGYLFGLILGYLIDFVGNKILKHIMLKRKSFNIKNAVWVHGIALVAMTVLIFIFLVVLTNTLPDSGEQSLQIPLWTIQLIAFAQLVLCLIISHKIKKNDTDTLTTIEDVYSNEDIIKTIEKSTMARFEKMNQKREKKGKPPISEQEFLKDELKSCKKELSPIPYILMAVIIPLIFSAVKGFDGFEGVNDFLMFYGICLIVGGLIVFMIYRSTRKIALKRIAWIESKITDRKE